MRPHLGLDLAKGMLAGAAATAATSLLMIAWGLAAPAGGTDIIALLAQWLGGGALLGWMAHVLIGAVLWGSLFALVEPTLPGAASLRGVLFAIGAWLVMMLVLLPWAGAGVFAARLDQPVRMTAGSIVLHLVYGWVLGFVYGRLIAPETEEHARSRGYTIH